MVWQRTCSFISLVFDIDKGHSDRFKWCTVQMEASPGKPGSNVKTRSEMGYRFSGSGLKRGLKNNIFWSEIGSGFWEPCGTPLPKFLGSTPLPGFSSKQCDISTICDSYSVILQSVVYHMMWNSLYLLVFWCVCLCSQISSIGPFIFCGQLKSKVETKKYTLSQV